MDMLFRKILLISVFLVFSLSISLFNLSQSAWGQEQNQATVPNKMHAFTIKHKTHQGILTNEGFFNVTWETKVVMGENREISYDLLPTPCEAKITYEPVLNGNQTATKIQVINTLPGSSRSFSRPLPE